MKRLVWVVIALQLAVLAWVAAEREWIMARGTTVWLRTAPVDPRDAFRGDYVQLDYEIGHPSQGLAEPLKEAFESTYSPVYAQLVTDAEGVARVASFARELPAEGPVIRGRVGTQVQRDWRNRSAVAYGIEKYFVPQGEGYALENRRGERDGWQTPMEVEVALSTTGTAVIKGHRWSPMGIRLDVLEVPQNAQGRRSPKLRMSLRNQGEAPVLLVDDARHCAFSLWQVDGSQWQGERPVPWAGRDCSRWQHGALDWVVLAPGAVHSVAFDFADPAWFVQGSEGAVELADFNRDWARYRLVYAPPDVELPEGLMRVWLSPLQSAAFNAGGRVD